MVWGTMKKLLLKPKDECLHRGPELYADAAGRRMCVCHVQPTRLCIVDRKLGATGKPVVSADINSSRGMLRADVGNCACCPMRLEKLPKRQEITRRNLIYHVCPLKANEHWRQNLAKLRKHIDLFNGRRLIATAGNGPGQGHGYDTHGSAEVHKELDGCNCEFMDIYNDPVLRERTTFLQLLLAVANDHQDEATFYGHTKGIATLDTSDKSMTDETRIRGSVRWRNMMYAKLLGDWKSCMKLLRRYDCVGTTQIACAATEQWPWPEGLRYGWWHYAGTFFWFRHSGIFTRPAWRNVICHHYGVEAWLGGFVPLSMSTSVFQPFDCYTPPWHVYEPATYGKEFDE